MNNNRSDKILSFADRFAEMIFIRYPEWEQYRVDPDTRWQIEDDLAVEVPSRFSPKCPLRIETMNDGIIINWVGWHIHCDDWGGTYTEDEFISKTFEIIDGILAEEYVVVITWRDGPGGTGSILKSDTMDQELQKGFWAKMAKDKQVVAISWNGDYDRGQFDPAKC